MARQLLQGWAPEEMGTASVTCPGAASPPVAPPSFSVVAAAATCHQTKPGPGPPAPHTTPVHTPVCQSPAAVTGTHAGVASLRPRPCTCTCCFCQPPQGAPASALHVPSTQFHRPIWLHSPNSTPRIRLFPDTAAEQPTKPRALPSTGSCAPALKPAVTVRKLTWAYIGTPANGETCSLRRR